MWPIIAGVVLAGTTVFIGYTFAHRSRLGWIRIGWLYIGVGAALYLVVSTFTDDPFDLWVEPGLPMWVVIPMLFVGFTLDAMALYCFWKASRTDTE